jgi:hypothetical protein
MRNTINAPGETIDTNRSCHPIFLDAVKAAHFVEIRITKFCLFYRLLIESAF